MKGGEMSEEYSEIIKSLYNQLSLTPANNIEDITSLQIDQHVCHITEYPEGQLLMFANIGHLDNLDLKALLTMNMFSQLLYKPMLAFDEFSNGAVIWSRQAISLIQDNAAYKQLELLADFADKAIETQTGVFSDKGVEDEKPSSNVEFLNFKV